MAIDPNVLDETKKQKATEPDSLASYIDSYRQRGGLALGNPFQQQETTRQEEPGFFQNVAGDVAGGIIDYGEMMGRAGRAIPGGDSAGVDEGGISSKVIGWAEQFKKDNPWADRKDREGLSRWFHEGLRSAVTSLAAGVPGAAVGAAAGTTFGPVGTFLGGLAGYALSGATTFGMAEYDSFLQEADAKGISREESEPMAILSAGAEGGFEFLGDLLQGATLGGTSVVTAPGKAALKTTVKEMLKLNAKQALKRAPIGMGFETGSELLTAGVQTEAQRKIGLTDQKFFDGATQAFGPSLVASAIFQAVGFGGVALNQRAARNTLANADADPEQRLGMVQAVDKAIREQNPELADRWNRTATEAVLKKEALDLDTEIGELPSGQPSETPPPGPRPTRLSALNQIEEEIFQLQSSERDPATGRPAPKNADHYAQLDDLERRKQTLLESLTPEESADHTMSTVNKEVNQLRSELGLPVHSTMAEDESVSSDPGATRSKTLLPDEMQTTQSRPQASYGTISEGEGVGTQMVEKVAGQAPQTAQSRLTEVEQKIANLNSVPETARSPKMQENLQRLEEEKTNLERVLFEQPGNVSPQSPQSPNILFAEDEVSGLGGQQTSSQGEVDTRIPGTERTLAAISRIDEQLSQLRSSERDIFTGRPVPKGPEHAATIQALEQQKQALMNSLPNEPSLSVQAGQGRSQATMAEDEGISSNVKGTPTRKDAQTRLAEVKRKIANIEKTPEKVRSPNMLQNLQSLKAEETALANLFVEPGNVSPAGQQAPNILYAEEEGIGGATSNDSVTEKSHSNVPNVNVQKSLNYSDPRLKRKEFRDVISGYTDSITTAGKNPTSFVDLGAEGTQVIRHGSVHPPLIQKAIATAGSVKDLRNAVRKAANGDKLGTRQAEAVKLVLDQMQEEVNLVREGEVRNVRGKQTELRNRRDAYRETAQPATGEELEATRNSGENAQAEQISDDFYIPPAEEANEYPAEWDAETKTLADLYAEARKYDNEAADSLLESQAEDSEIATQLWEIIQDGRKGEGSSQVVQGEGFSLKGEAQKRQAREEEQLGLSGIKAAKPEFGKRPDLDKGRENVERLPLADEIAEKEADAAQQDLFGVADQNPASVTDKEGRVAPVSDKAKPKKRPKVNAQRDVPSNRFKPSDIVVFGKDGITGPSGAKLRSYAWAYTFEEYVDSRGEDRTRRTSDWELAEESDDTGRGVVHKFTVEMPDGRTVTGSLESALKLLGFSDNEAPAKVKNLVSMAKTLARNKMNLAVLKQQQEELSAWRKSFNEALQNVDVLNAPPMEVVRNGNKTRFSIDGVGPEYVGVAANRIVADPQRFKEVEQEARDYWASSEAEKVAGKKPKTEPELASKITKLERDIRKAEKALSQEASVAGQKPTPVADNGSSAEQAIDKTRPDAPISRATHDVSVDDTVYLQDDYENKRHPVNFRGWIDNDTAMVIYNGWQMSFSRERLFKNDLASNDVAPASDKEVTTKTTKTKDGEQTKGTEQKIEDFGEEIGGARKMLYAEAYGDKLKEAKDVDVSAAPLSKSWPEPDYAKLLEGGMDSWSVSFIRSLRDQIPTKPQKRWKLSGWAKAVNDLRALSEKVLSGEFTRSAIEENLKKSEYLFNDLTGKAELYEAVGHEQSLKDFRVKAGQYTLYEGVKYDTPKTIWTVEKPAKATAFSNWPQTLAKGETREEVIAAFKKNFANIKNDKTDKQVSFAIYQKRGEDGAFIGKKIGKDYVDLEKFDTITEARKYLKENNDKLTEKLGKFKEVPNERKESNSPRVGEDHRNDADITPEIFSETFGFRGVQFGNYVEGKKRQEDLNQAYDALMDLAGVLGVEPKALSLNGELGLAFGARGTGGRLAGGAAAAAHYESGRVVINLTKNRGAGSLAHEWWHGLDNYFSRMRGDKGNYLTHQATPSEGVRPEMVRAFMRVMNAIAETGMQKRAALLDKTLTKPYWGTKIEMSARSFESYVIAKLQDQGASNDYLANIVSPEYWDAAAALGMEKKGSYPYPSPAEVPAIRAAFDEFFREIETKKTDKGVALFSQAETTNDKLKEDVDRLKNRVETLKAKFTKQEVEAEIKRLTSKWKNAPKIIVIESVDELPGDIKDQALSMPDGDKVEGVFLPGPNEIFIISSNMPSMERIGEIVVHEAIGHHGIESIVDPKEFNNILLQISLVRQEELKKVAESYGFSLTSKEERLSAAKEVLARMAERGESNGFVRRTIALIKDALRRLGFKLEYTDTDFKALIAKGRKFVEKGVTVSGKKAGLAQFAAAWHGTPHKFDRFSTEFVGAGEGAQAYGWGLYFAGSKEVAKHYQKVLSSDAEKITASYNAKYLSDPHEPSRDGWKVFGWGPGGESQGSVVLYDTETDAESKGKLQRFFGKEVADDFFKKLDETDSWEISGEGFSSGHLYQVELAPKEDEYLLWDKPLSEQSAKVKAALSDSMGVGIIGKESGQILYHHLSGKMSLGSDKAASEYLHSIGIRGIKYPDGTSRGKGEGDFNYVIFDDNDVEIKAQFSLSTGDTTMDAELDKTVPGWRDHVAQMTHKASGTIPERAKAMIGKFLSNPWFGSEGKPARRQVVNQNLQRTEDRTAMVYDLSHQTDNYQGMEGLRTTLGKMNTKQRRGFDRLVKKGDIENMAYSDDELKQMGVSASTIKAYHAFRQVIDKSRDMMFERLNDLALIPYEGTPIYNDLKELMNSKRSVKEIKEDKSLDEDLRKAFVRLRTYRTRLTELKQQWGFWKGYAPRVRPDGEWFVRAYQIGADGNRKQVYMRPAISRTGAESLMAKVQKNPSEYLKGNYDKNTKYEFKVDRNTAVPEEMMQMKGSDMAIEALINRAVESATKAGDMTESQASAMTDAILQELNDQIAARGFGRTRIERQKDLIEGYDDENYADILQSHISGMAGWITKSEFSIRSTRAASKIKDPSDKTWVLNYSHDAMANSTYLDRAMAQARSYATLMYLGGKISTSVLNATQNYIVGQAELSRHTKGALRKILAAQKNVLTGKLTEEEARILEKGLRAGRTQAQYVREISGLSEAAPTGKLGKGISWLTQKSMVPFQWVESRWNREPALLAAYRVFRNEHKLSEEDAFKKAEDFVNTVHFVIGKENIPEVLRKLGPLGRTLYTFQSYTHNYLHWLANRVKQGETAVIGRSMLALALLGGLVALPGADDIDKWLQSLIGKAPMMELRKWLKGATGEEVADFVMHGLPSLGGVNFSRSLGVSIPFLQADQETMAERFTGVWSGVAKKVSLTGAALRKGDLYRAAENSPLTPEAFANVMRASRQYTRGATTLSGKPIFDEKGKQVRYTFDDALKKSLGFQPLGQAKRSETFFTGKRLEEYWKGRRQDMIDSYRIAKDKKAVWKDIREFNRELKGSAAATLVKPVNYEVLLRAMKPSINKKQQAFGRENT